MALRSERMSPGSRIIDRLSKTKPIRLGPFELQELIGRGGMAAVWRGVHVGQKVTVAIKVITSLRAHEAQFLQAFRNEVQAVARLHHPGIVLVLDHGEVSKEAADASQ